MLKIEGAGLVEYNNLNCRCRTAFVNDKGEEMYLEFSSGVYFEKERKDEHWLVINGLFYLKDEKESYSKELYPIIKRYYEEKNNYTRESIKKLLEELGLNEDFKIVDYYVDKEYRPFKSGKGFNLGNEPKQAKKESQLSLFEGEL